MSARNGFAAVAVSVLFNVAAVDAHDIVVFSGKTPGGEAQVSYGHPQDWQPIDGNRLVELREVAADGSSVDLTPRPDAAGKNLFTAVATKAGASCVVAARYDNGVWTRLDNGTFRNARRSLVRNGTRTVTSTKYAKGQTERVLPGRAPCERIVGHRLEIVPSPGQTAIGGGSFRVRVLWEGKPLPGVGVEVGDGVTAKKEEDILKVMTDADGYAQLTLGAPGWQILAVDHESLPDIPALSDADMHIATFTFFLGGGN